MANANVQRSAEELSKVLEDRDVMGIATVGLLGAGGVALAQQITEEAMPFLDMSPTPSTTRGFATSAVVKVVLAALTVMVANRFSSRGEMWANLLAVGMVLSAGADALNIFAESGVPFLNAQAGNRARATGQRSGRRPTSGSVSRSTSASSGASAATAAAGGGGSARVDSHNRF